MKGAYSLKPCSWCADLQASVTKRVAPLVQVHERALPSPLFARLLRGITTVGEERFRTGYQTTFWFDFSQRPTSLVELAVLSLKKKVPGSFAGVEWWLSRMRTSNVKVDFHQDRDNAWFEQTGKTRTPAVSTVLYLNSCRGGLLAVTMARPNPRNLALAPDRHDFDLVAPAPNRFVCFDGSLTHGVLDSENEIPGKRRPREPSLRLAIAINFWKKRPLSVPAFTDTRFYRALEIDSRPGVRARP